MANKADIKRGTARGLSGEGPRWGSSDGPAAVRCTGNCAVGGSRHDARHAAFLCRQCQPAAHRQIKSFGRPCFDDRSPCLHTAQQVSTNLQRRHFIRRMEKQDAGRINAQINKARAVNLSAIPRRGIGEHPQDRARFASTTLSTAHRQHQRKGAGQRHAMARHHFMHRSTHEAPTKPRIHNVIPQRKETGLCFLDVMGQAMNKALKLSNRFCMFVHIMFFRSPFTLCQDWHDRSG